MRGPPAFNAPSTTPIFLFGILLVVRPLKSPEVDCDTILRHPSLARVRRKCRGSFPVLM